MFVRERGRGVPHPYHQASRNGRTSLISYGAPSKATPTPDIHYLNNLRTMGLFYRSIFKIKATACFCCHARPPLPWFLIFYSFRPEMQKGFGWCCYSRLAFCDTASESSGTRPHTPSLTPLVFATTCGYKRGLGGFFFSMCNSARDISGRDQH